MKKNEKKGWLYISSLLLLLMVTCKPTSTEKVVAAKPIVLPIDTSINVTNAVFPEFFDSTQIENFLVTHNEFNAVGQQIKNFYRQRNFQYAWYDKDGLADHTGAFINQMIGDIQAGPDSLKVAEELDKLTEQVYWGSSTKEKNKPDIQSDLLLTAMYFKQAFSLEGRLPDAAIKDLGWYIPRKKINIEQALAEMIKDTSRMPIHPMYFLLRQKAGTLKEIQAMYDKDTIDTKFKKSIPLKGSHSILPEIWHRLYLLKDLANDDTSQAYTEDKLAAVVNFRKRHGMVPDTAIGNDFIAELNKPLADRIKTIYVNMERLRWLPAEMYGEYLLVNIPEYKVHAFVRDSLLWSMRVVVGAVNTKTVIFKDEMNQVVFRPNWYPPHSIVQNEIFGPLKKNPVSYLAKHDMEIVDNKKNRIPASSIQWGNYTASSFPYTIRQKSGIKNALGKVKFLFPNEHSIYMHDTPSKKYFNETTRAYSHGCIRVSDPQKLAEYVLRHNPEWTPQKIKEAMEAGSEKYVKLAKEVPVVIGYFTSWVDTKGNLNFRPDVYNNDASMAERLFQ